MESITLHSAYFFRGDIIPVTVETTVTDGIGIHIIGLPDRAIKDTLLRVATSLEASGYSLPGKKVVIKIEPHGGIDMWAGAYRPAECSEAYDLAIALGILAAIGKIARPSWTQYSVDDVLIFGKLDNTGNIHHPFTGIESNSAAAVLDYQLRRDWNEILGYYTNFYGSTLWDNCGTLQEAVEKFTKF